MQKLPTSVLPGSTARVRTQRWRVERVSPEPPCAALDLSGAAPSNAGVRLTVIAPFDDAVPLASPQGGRRLRGGPALGLVAAALASGVPWPAPECLLATTLDLQPHQLTATLALRTGRAKRVLVADPVGSGKTIQAAIAIADTLRDHRDGRVLIVVPAGLKPQWARELRDRLGLTSRIVDSQQPSAAGQEPPRSPWRLPGVTLTSLDYVKRRDVLPGLEGSWWHLLVVDEAHHAAGPTERSEAIDALGRRSLCVILLTATPHDGDSRRFETLRGIGAHGSTDRVLLVRREMSVSTHRARRLHLRTVQPGSEELHAMQLLQRYLEALRRHGGQSSGAGQVELLASTIEKRAASSPFALARTLARRRALIDEEAGPWQPSLGFGCFEDEGDGEVAATLLGASSGLNRRSERAWLGTVIEAADRAARSSRRFTALHTLLRRLRQPVVVFTEYRDTLAWLFAGLRSLASIDVLHGGLTPAERERVVERFGKGLVAVLLATDVAAEGLNLQHASRAAVLFDLPWSPARAEQRIGRIDRLGQTRRVHAWLLVGPSASDRRVLDHLERRRASASALLARCAEEPTIDVERDVGELEHWCVAELSVRRRLLRLVPPPLRDNLASVLAGEPRVARLSPRQARSAGLGPHSALVVATTACWTDQGDVVERITTALSIETQGCARLSSSGEATRTWLHVARAASTRALAGAASDRQALLRVALGRARSGEAARATQIDRELRTRVAAHFLQPGLFEVHTRSAPLPPGVGLPLSEGPERVDVQALTNVALVLAPRRFR